LKETLHFCHKCKQYTSPLSHIQVGTTISIKKKTINICKDQLVLMTPKKKRGKLNFIVL